MCRLSVTEKDIQDLCKKMKQTALRNCEDDKAKLKIKNISINTLISWGILLEKDNKLLPTNAFTLLSGNPALPTMIQCGVFKGTTRSIFVDRREFTGPIQDQIEEAYKYVLAKINLGANIHGLYRQDEYELPINSIRKIIANAVTYRSYLDPGNVQVALFDDRLEVTSPGMLLNGVTIEKMKEGYSKIRNRAIASAFSYMKIIEQWGSGIPRLLEEFRGYGLPEPEFIDFDGDLRVNLYRTNTNQTNQTARIQNETEYDVIKLMKENQVITQEEIASRLGINLSTVKYYTTKLRKKGIIARKGTGRRGTWMVLINLD